LNSGTATMPDRDILQGRWVAVTAERGGAQVEQLADVAVVFRGDCATLQLPGAGGKPAEKIELPFTHDTTRTPRRISIGDGSAEAVRGIYTFLDGRLQLCLALKRGDAWPTAFGSRPGSNQVYLTLRRAGARALQGQ